MHTCVFFYLDICNRAVKSCLLQPVHMHACNFSMHTRFLNPLNHVYVIVCGYNMFMFLRICCAAVRFYFLRYVLTYTHMHPCVHSCS
jgi:hypothetical protein